MTDFCSWIAVDGERGLSEAHRLRDAHSRAGTHVDTSPDLPGFGLVRGGSGPGVGFFSDGSNHAVISGTPVWKSDAMASESRQTGFGNSLLDAFRASGEKVFEQLEGPFSLLIVADRGRRVYFGVDKMGISTLSFSMTDSLLIVGTSTLAVAKALAAPPKVNLQSIFDYAFFHVIPSPDTVFTGIEKAQPAHVYVHESGALNRNRYWLPTFANRESGIELGTDSLLGCIHAAIERATAGGGIAGCYLSGGLDSSTIAGVLAKQTTNRPVDAYTVGFAEEGYDEMEFARAAAERFSLNLHEIYIGIDDIVELTQRVTAAFDEPFGNSSAIPALFCAEAAKADGIDVMLAGDGGDELFGGNERYAKQKVFDVYRRIPAFIRNGLLHPMFGRRDPDSMLPGLSKIASYVQQASVPMPDRLHSYNFVRRTGPAAIFTDSLMASVSEQHPYGLLKSEFDDAPTDNLVDQMLFLDWKFILADNDLRKVGKTAAAAGVTVEYPLLDDGVLEYSTALRPGDKVRRLRLRHHYKAALVDFLPDKIINKSKHGFGLPFGEWLRTSPELKNMVLPAVDALVERDILRSEFVADLKQRHAAEHASFYGNILWVLFMLESWFAAHTTGENFG